MKQHNILIFFDRYCNEHSRGGTEKAAYRIASALKSTGKFNPYVAYQRFSDNDVIDTKVFRGSFRLPKAGPKFVDELEKVIRQNDIDVIVNNGSFTINRLIRKAVDRSGRHVKLLVMHHNVPGTERIKYDTKFNSATFLKSGNPLGKAAKSIFLPLFKAYKERRNRRMYARVASESDGIVLLSPSYIDEFRQIAGMPDRDKFVAIPNIVNVTDSNQNLKKEKRVLMLSRMTEMQKRISLALKVWEKIERQDDLADWQLDIVGDGKQLPEYKRLAAQLGLKRVNFLGWQDSLPYLKRSAILMMTSLYEGLSLSMIEALYYGAVPIAYNSYSSLKDVVKHGRNGLAIEPFADIDAFAGELARLMRDDDRREKMMAEAMESSKRYLEDSVRDLWVDYLTSKILPPEQSTR